MQHVLNPRHKRIFAVKDGAPSSAQVPTRVPPNISFFGKSDAEDRELQRRILNDVKFDPSSAAAGGAGTDIKKDDMSMVTAMAARLRAAEAQVKALRDDCKAKDRLIYDLQKQLTELSTEGNPRDRPSTAPSQEHPQRSNSGDLVLIKEANARLRLQLEEMHQFLADYGLKWVGGEKQKLEAEPQSVKQPSQGPEALGFELDMQKILAHAKELNGITGQKRLAKHGPIRQFETLPEVCITFYRDGLLVRNGPARPYAMKESRLLVRDLIDGYFPFEFKQDFPDGVQLLIQDKLNESCVQVRQSCFEGVGHRLESGPIMQPPTQKDPDTCADLAGLRALRARHGGVAPEHLHRFLQRLPQNVIVGGEVVNVRGGIAAITQQPAVAHIFTEQEPTMKLGRNSIEDAVNHLVQAAENIVSSPLPQKGLPKSSDSSSLHILVVRQSGGEALPKMQLSSDTTVGSL